MWKFIAIILVLLVVCRANAAEPMLADAQADFDAARYPAALAKISRVLSGSAAKVDPSQRYDLFMLRGECMLRNGDSTGAADAFAHALREVDIDNEADKGARARAMELLVKAAPRGVYRSSQDAAPINIVSADSRKAAMAVMLERRFAAAQPKIGAAIESSTLPPTKTLLPAIADLYAIELTATGDVVRTRAAIGAVDEHARRLLDSELVRIHRRANELHQLANRAVLSYGPWQQLSYRGLTTPERNELRTLTDTLVEIEKVIRDGQRINTSIGSDAEAWKTLLERCNSIELTAEQTYKRSY